MKQCLFLVLTIASNLVLLPGGAKAQVYAGEGTAVMGSAMTPSSTKELAFEKARQSALETFGARVVSEHTIASIETPRGIQELSKRRISVLAAGETSLVEGSKTVQREMTDEALLYRVTARFRIEPTDFEETLRAYLQTGPDAPLRQSLQDATTLQQKLTQVGPDAEDEEVRRLIKRTQHTYEQVAAAVDNIDGSSVRSKIARQRRRRKNALLRFFRGVREHGHPQDLLRLSLSRVGIEDEGRRVRFTYQTGLALTRHARKIMSLCRETRPTWAPDDSRDNGVIGGPATDGWLQQIFEDGYLDFEVTGPFVLYMLDGAGHVRLVVAKATKGMMSPPSVRFQYGGCDQNTFLHTRIWANTWEFNVPTRLVGEIERAVLAVSTWDYREIAGRHGFRAVEQGIYTRGEGQSVGLEAFTYDRKQLNDYVDTHAEKVKQMPPAP
jgi:hypothetical protein